MSVRLYISSSTQDKNVGVGGYGTEENQMMALGDLIQSYISQGGGDIQVFRNSPSMTLEQTVADSNAKQADYHLALHTNAGGGKGTECYYYYDTAIEGKLWANVIYNAVAPLTKAADRGCHPDNILYDTGLYENRLTNAWACLIEIMFHDNLDDVRDYLTKIKAIAMAITRAIYDYFDMEYRPAEPVEPITPRKDYATILKEVSEWASIYIADLQTMHKPGHNWHGLIEKLYYTLPK